MASRAPTRLCLSALLVAVAALAAEPAALAAPPVTTATGAPSPADKETARALMDQGDDRMEAKDYAGALKAYGGADAIMHLPMTAVALARAQEALGLLVEARDAALGALHAPVQPGETAVYARARVEAGVIATRLVPRISSLQLTLVERPPGLEVTIDGALLPAAVLDAPRKVNPGKHVVAARAPGYQDLHVEVALVEGGTTPLSLTLARSATAAPLPVPVGAPSPLPAPAPPPAPAPVEGSHISPLVFAGFGVAGAGLVVGAITGGLSLSKTSQLATTCPDKHCAAGTLSTPTLLANVANIGFGVAAAGAILGVVGIALPRGGPAQGPATATALRVLLGPTSVGLAGQL